MKALIIAAHGSRKNQSNQEVERLAGKIGENTGHHFERVTAAFLQFGQPLLEDRIDELADKGSKKIVIFPFFIGSGSHIQSDIPRIAEQASEKYPQIDIRVTRHLGSLEAIEDVIIKEVTNEI